MYALMLQKFSYNIYLKIFIFPNFLLLNSIRNISLFYSYPAWTIWVAGYCTTLKIADSILFKKQWIEILLIETITTFQKIIIYYSIWSSQSKYHRSITKEEKKSCFAIFVCLWQKGINKITEHLKMLQKFRRNIKKQESPCQNRKACKSVNTNIYKLDPIWCRDQISFFFLIFCSL